MKSRSPRPPATSGRSMSGRLCLRHNHGPLLRAPFKSWWDTNRILIFSKARTRTFRTKSRATTRGDDGAAFAMRLDVMPMEARSAEALPDEPGRWQFEPKWDGFRCLAFKEGEAVELRGKSGKSLSRFFPEVLATLREAPFRRFVVDGELVIELNGRLTFDALQARLHPAESRIRRLSMETPARLILFDMLVGPDGSEVAALPLAERRSALEIFGQKGAIAGKLIVTPCSRDLAQARSWLADFDRDGRDGVVAKRLDAPYLGGERAMLKVKRLRTADCVVAGFRYLNSAHEVGSLLLGLYNAEGKLSRGLHFNDRQ